MLTIKTARQPRWTNVENTALDLYVAFEETAETLGEIPFTAVQDDVHGHGCELFARAVAGEFGEIAACVVTAPTEAELRAQWKLQREQLVAAIIVKTKSGRLFDGDETSQSRMARAIVSLSAQAPKATVRWTLADNSLAYVGADELKEALTMAGLRQSELWVMP